MATVKFRLRSQAKENVTIFVYLSVRKGEMYQCKTPFTINPKDWKIATSKRNKSLIGFPKQNNETNKTIFNKLKTLDAYIFSNLNQSLSKGVLIDKHWLDKQINDCFGVKQKSDNGLLLNHIQYIIDNANTRKVKGRSKIGISISRIKGYKSFKKLIENYETHIKKKIHLMDINMPFVNRFTNWLINTKKYSVGYAGKAIDNLKTVCVDAQSLQIETNPYVNNIQSFKEEKGDRYFETLSFDELETIKNTELNDSLNNARKWLLIGCEIGQRGSDLLNITRDNFRYNGEVMYLDITQQKGGKEVTIGIIAPHVRHILENEMPHKISSQKFNDYLKEVCRLSGIDEIKKGKVYDKKTKRKKLGMYPKYELISSHICRRSFATNYYKKVPTAILIHYTGHSKESEFLKYIGKPQDKDENANLFMKFYKEINKDVEPQLKAV